MARRVRDASLETRESRRRLAVRPEPHWRALDQGLHLGYRRRPSGGSWTVRRRKTDAAAGSPYEEAKLGAADDIQDGDGLAVLTFWQAQEAARRWFQEAVRREAGLEPVTSGPYTVSDALRDYLAHYGTEGKALAATTSAANAHIEPTLGPIELTKLTTKQIVDWHKGLAATPGRLRARKNQGIKHRRASTDPNAVRSRRATANRILTVLRAALNFAWKEGKISIDTAWRRVKPFRNVDAPVIRYLTEAECLRLVNACDTDLRKIVRAALLTGCRYGELTALTVRDFNPDTGTLTIRTSKSGKPRHVVLTDEGQKFFTDLSAGQTGASRLLQRTDGARWGTNHQQRPLREACKHAKITPAISFHILRHTHGSILAMKGVPSPVIAKQLGHADTRMTEKHYAHLAPSYVADTIRASFPDLGIIEKPGSLPMQRVKG